MSPRDVPLPNASDLRPDETLVTRFRQDLEAITGEAPSAGRRLGLAVSGGPDSMAMLLLGAAAYPGAVCAATVDHGLRPEAPAEAEAVHEICGSLSVPHQKLRVSETLYPIGNLQERARIARYWTIDAWAVEARLPWVAVAHQRDDVAETFLMRARRGAGVGGLAAMRRSRSLNVPAAERPNLVRPLLDWPRCELSAIVAKSGVTSVQDPSNTDPRFDRSRTRALIAATPELVAQRLARAAHNLRHAEDAIEWVTGREWQTRHRFVDHEDHVEGEQPGVWLDACDLPYEIRRRLARRAITTARLAHNVHWNWREQGLDRLIATLDSGGTGTLAGVQARVVDGKWHFRLAPPRRSH